MAAAALPGPTKMRWGELDEDDGGDDFDFLLPPRVVEGPDENGVKRTVEYRFDDEGNKVKVTTTTRVRKLARARLSKRALERRAWPKFGDAVREDVGARLTMVSTEEIVLERPRAPGRILSPPFPLSLSLVFCIDSICCRCLIGVRICLRLRNCFLLQKDHVFGSALASIILWMRYADVENGRYFLCSVPSMPCRSYYEYMFCCQHSAGIEIMICRFICELLVCK